MPASAHQPTTLARRSTDYVPAVSLRNPFSTGCPAAECSYPSIQWPGRQNSRPRLQLSSRAPPETEPAESSSHPRAGPAHGCTPLPRASCQQPSPLRLRYRFAIHIALLLLSQRHSKDKCSSPARQPVGSPFPIPPDSSRSRPAVQGHREPCKVPCLLSCSERIGSLPLGEKEDGFPLLL